MAEISISAAEVIESDGTYGDGMQFVVTLSEASDTDIYIDYQTFSGTAIEGVDFVAGSGTLHIPAGDTSAVITITTYGGTEVETDESFILELTNPVGASFAGDAVSLQAQGVILDNDSTDNTLALLVGDAKIVEGDSGQTEAVFEVRLSQASEETITLSYTTSDATAEAGSDYEAVTGTVTFLPGETVKSVSVAVNGDAVSEATEQFSLVVTPTEAIANGTSDATGTATILDDDAGDGTVPVVTISSGELVEGDSTYNTMQFVLTLSEASDTAVTIDYQTISGAAEEYVDFPSSSGTITIPAGDTSAILNITTYGYTEVETDESFTVELTNPVGAAFAGDAVSLQAQGVILDDDGTESTLALLVNDAKIVEGDSGQSEAVFEIRLSQVSEETITLNYTTSDATAEAGSDYEAVTGTVTFLPGETVKSVSVAVNRDVVSEATEQFSLVVTPTAAIANGTSDATGTATILDDDAGDGTVPVVTISSAELVEGDSTYNTMQFVVTLSEASDTAVTIDYQTISGTAEEYVDFPSSSGTITIPAGDTSAILNITTYGYSEVETDESFTVELTNPVGAAFAGDAVSLQAQGVILDDDGTESTLALLVSDAKIVEGDSGQSEAVFEIRLSQASEETITLSYTTSDATAEAGSDYEAVTGTVTFLPGETVKSVSVAVNGDAVSEATEQFSLVVTPTAAIANGTSDATGTATILDDDAGDGTVPVVTISSGELVEGDSTYNTMQFVLTLSEASDTAVTIDYQTISGAAEEYVDFPSSSGTITIPAGDTSAILNITTYGYTEVETDESFTVELTNPVGAAFAGDAVSLQAQGVILDDDGTESTLALLVSDAKIVEGDSGQSEAVFEIRLSQASEETITLSYTTSDATAEAGSDYEAVTGTVTFQPGETVKSVSVAVNGDEVSEDSEQFSLVLSSVEGDEFGAGAIDAEAVATIMDDDAGDTQPVITIFSTHAVEGDSTYGNPMQFVVMLSEASSETVQVDYTTVAGSAAAGSDYITQSGTLTIAPGGTSTVISITTYGGTVEEVDEAFSLELSSPVNAVLAGGVETLSADGTIIDDDNDGLAEELPQVSVSDIQVREASGGATATFTLTLSSASASDINGDFSVESGTATAIEDFTPVSGTFSFEAGETSTTITVEIAEDTIIESTETIVLRLDALENAEFSSGSDQLLAICEILDQGVAPVAKDDDFTTDEDSVLTGYVLLDNGNGADSDADGDALTVLAVEGEAANVGQTITLASGALLTLNSDGSFAYDPNGQFDGLAAEETAVDSFEYTVSDSTGWQDTAQVTINFSGVNDAPVGYADAFTAVENTDIIGNVFDDNGSGADIDPDGDDIAAALETQATNGTVELNSDGSFTYTPDADYVGTDSFTYTISDGEAASDPVTVTLTVTDDGSVEEGPFSTTLDVPDSMTTCEEGTTTITYTNDSSESYSGVLILVEITGGLLADPQTGTYSDSLFLVGMGDGEGDIESGESGSFELDTKLVSYPGQEATVTVSVIDLDETIDWSSQKDLLKPEFLSDEAWDQIFENFMASLGETGEELADVLAENAEFLEEYGVDGSNATTALAFELEQAGDFGSLAERSAEGSLGDGWAFIGDLGLEISETTGSIAFTGSTDFSALFDLSAENSAYYIVSSSVDQTVTLSGDLVDGAPDNRPTFSQNVDGSYTVSGDFSGELTQTDDGYQIETDSGLTLYFDQDGNFIKITTQSGLETTAVYDDDGNLSGVVGPYGETLTITRDESGQVTAIEDSSGDTVDLTYTDGQLTEAATADSTASFTYDMDGYLARTTSTGEPVTAFTYDDDGRLQSVDVGSGTEAATYEYDSLGGYTVTDGAGTATHVALAPSGSVTAVTNGLGETTSLLYDESGTLTGIELADGSVVDITVDDLGRITSITDADGSTVSYTYEGDSTSPSSFTDAEGNTRSFTYNDLGQMTSAEWPDGTSLTFTWDEDGNLDSYTSRSGETITYAYDDEGNLISESDGTTGETDYLYDDAGQLISATTDEGTTTISYDDAGNVTSIEYPSGLSLSYTYDEAGNRTSMTDQGGNTQTYTWDEAGNLATVSNDDGLMVAYTYDAGGNLIQEENGNGTITTYSYNEAGRLLEIVDFDDEGDVNSYVTYSYDELGQRTSMETEDGIWTYDYDGSGQLISADFDSVNSEIDDTSIQYNYDDAGNRTSVIEDGVETVYVTNELNQYVSVGDETYTYDDNGNLISKTDEDGTWSYTYDVENRLISVTGPSGDVTAYEYDVFGNRSAVTENGVTTTYLVDPFGLGYVVAEYDEDGETIASYLNGLGLVAQVAADGSVGYYNTDGVYSVTGITDDSGELVNEYVYTPFGEELYESETIDNGYEFNGGLGVYEDDNDLIYMRARYYDSEDGRFISEDSCWQDGDPGNLYRFAYNDPNGFVDSSGKNSQDSGSVFEDLKKQYEEKQKAAETQAENQKEADEYYKKHGIDPERLKGSYNPNNLQDLEDMQFEPLDTSTQTEENSWDAYLDSIKKQNTLEDNITSGTSSTEDDGTGDDGTGDDGTGDDGTGGKEQPDGSVYSDPHIKTFDNLYYDFMAAGEFTLVRGEDLEIQIRTEPYSSSSSLTITSAVAMQVGDAVVGFYFDNPGVVNINGEFVELEVGETVSVGGGAIYMVSGGSYGGTYVVVNENGDGFLAYFKHATIDVRPFLCTDRNGLVSGLLGNADGDSSNDIALSDGTVLSDSGTVAAQVLYTDYADSWRVTDETSLFIYGDGESTATYTIENYPLKVITLDDLDPDARAAAEAVALAAGLVEGTPEFDAIVLDVAMTGDESFAEGIAEYTDPDEETDVLVVQEAPEPLDDTAQTDEDTSVFIDVLANDTDPEEDTLEIVSASDANGGTVEITDGGLLYTPPENFNGETVLTYEVTDGQGNTVSAEVTVTVAAVQDAPVAAADQFTTNEDTPVSGNVLDDNGNGADADVEGDSLTVIEVNGSETAVGSQITLDSGALLILNEDGSFSYDPNGRFDDLADGQEGTDSFEYTISDGQGGTDTQTVTVTISGIDGLTLDAGEDAVQEEGTIFSRLITFSDGLDADGDGWTYEINWGDGSEVETGTTTNTSFTISRDLTDGDTSQTVTVTVYDGDQSVVETFTLDTTNVAPAISLTGAAEVNEGDTYTLTLEEVIDPGDDTVTSFIVNWGDGSQDTIAAADIPTDGQLTHIYTDGSATPTITLDLVDEDGTHLNAGFLDVTVNNVAPELAVSGEDVVDEGAVYTLSLGDVVDPGDDTVEMYTIDWGDGVIDTIAAADLPGDGQLTHTYVSPGEVTIQIGLTDEDDTHQAVDGLSVTVSEPAAGLFLDAGDDASREEGTTFSRLITFSDGEDSGGDGWTYEINWGDGSEVETGTTIDTSFTISRDLTDGDTSQTVSVTIYDGDQSVVETFTLETTNTTPTILLTGAVEVNEGATYTLTLGEVIDPGYDTVTSFIVNWGDGSQETIAATDAPADGQLPHIYTNGGATPTITLDLVDEDGTYLNAGSLDVIVNNVAPELAVSGEDEVDEGAVYTLFLEDIVDPGDDTHSISIDWGDGSDIESVTVGTDSIDHVFSDGQSTATIIVTVADSDGATGSTSKTITVNNVAPSISLSGGDEIMAGQVYALTISDLFDPGDDTLSEYIIAWGDASDPETVLASELPADGVLTHVFENIGDYTISIDLSDEDGTYSDAATLTTTVTSQSNQDPVAHADVFITDEDGILTGNLLDDNGDGEDTDPDGDALSIVEVNGASANVGDSIALDSGALLTVTQDGQIEYDPNGQFDSLDSGETATDSFAYTVSDGNGGFDTQTATITISGASDSVVMLLGDAPDRLPRSDRNAWINAWSNEDVTITHKADVQDGDEAWSDILISGNGGSLLAGGDILSGDLGVSGTTGDDDTAALQEVDGTEALKFELDGTASQVTLDLTRFYADDDGNGNSESIRLQAYDDAHNLADEFVAVAETLSGDASLIFEVESGFSELVITSGAYDDSGEFIFGALSDGTENLSAVSGSDTGSDFMVESIEFDYTPTDDSDISLLGVADTTTDTLLG